MAVAFGLVAFTPAADLTEVLPVAVVITVAARLAAFAALRGAARKHLPRARPRRASVTARTDRKVQHGRAARSPYTAPTPNIAVVPNAAASGPSIAYPITPTP